MPNRFMIAGKNSIYQQPGADPAGVLIGFWHGVILPFTFFVSLFNPDVGIYETNNDGNWYNLGFFLGVAGTSGSGGASIG